MRPLVTQVKPPAVGLPPALRRDHFFFSSATRSDSKCCTEALHIACHDDLSPANVSSSFGSILHTSACPCISSAVHHGSVCYVQADCRKPASAACSCSYGWHARFSEVGLISERLQCQICCGSVGLQYLVCGLATWHGQFAVVWNCSKSAMCWQYRTHDSHL